MNGSAHISPGAGNPRRDEGIHIRLTTEQKNLLKEAADLLGESVANYVLATAIRDAARLIREHQTITLSPHDWTIFQEELLDESEPSERLKEAAERYQQNCKHSEGMADG